MARRADDFLTNYEPGQTSSDARSADSFLDSFQAPDWSRDLPKPIEPGNVELFNRPTLRNPDGSVSTTSSFSIGTDKGETLIPSVVNGKRLSKERPDGTTDYTDAIKHYQETGENLGTFKDAAEADVYAEALHNEQDRRLTAQPKNIDDILGPAPYQPTTSEKLFGRTDDGNKNVEGIAPALAEGVVNTLKGWGRGLMRGEAAVGDLIATLGAMVDSPDVSEDTRSAADRLQNELRQSAKDYWTTPRGQETPAGEVGGGIAELAGPLALTGGNPALLAASVTLSVGKDLVDRGVDASTAGKVAAIAGATTYGGAYMPFLGPTAATKIASGAVGNVVLGATEKQKIGQILEENGYPELAKDYENTAQSLMTDTLSGAFFGTVAHLAAGQGVRRAGVPPETQPREPGIDLQSFVMPKEPLLPPPGGGTAVPGGEEIPPVTPPGRGPRVQSIDEVNQFASRRQAELEAMPELAPHEQQELDWLRQPRSPNDIANAYGLNVAPSAAAGQPLPRVTPAEIIVTSKTRQTQLEAQTALTPVEQQELDSLRQVGNRPEAVATLYGRRLSEPVGERERAFAEMPVTTEEDRASPLPTDLIEQGRQVAQEAVGHQAAAEILEAVNFPPIGAAVTIDNVEGARRRGVVVDAYDQGGIQGAKIRLDDGGIIAEPFTALRGRVNQPEKPRAPVALEPIPVPVRNERAGGAAVAASATAGEPQRVPEAQPLVVEPTRPSPAVTAQPGNELGVPAANQAANVQPALTEQPAPPAAEKVSTPLSQESVVPATGEAATAADVKDLAAKVGDLTARLNALRRVVPAAERPTVDAAIKAASAGDYQQAADNLENASTALFRQHGPLSEAADSIVEQLRALRAARATQPAAAPVAAPVVPATPAAPITAPSGYELQPARRVTEAELRMGSPGGWTAVATRRQPFSSERGYGATEAAAQSDALARVTRKAAKPVTPQIAAPAGSTPLGVKPTAPTSIGENRYGQKLYEDANGVRSYADNGVRVSESVSLVPTRQGIKSEVDRANRSDRFLTTEEHRVKLANVTTPVSKRTPVEGRTLTPTEEPARGIQRPVPPSHEGARAEAVQPAPTERITERPPGPEVGAGAPTVRGTHEGRPEVAQRPAGTPAPSSGRAPSVGHPAGVPAGERPTEERGPAGRGSPAAGLAKVQGENYRIEPGALAEDRGPTQKARDNIAAIELMRAIEAEGRPATYEEQTALARYVGWGGLKGAFPDADGKFAKGFEKVGAQLRELLPETEYATARRSLQYAHYTAENVVRTMWGAAERLGFTGGKVFEPGMGVGNFAGLMPSDVAERTNYHGLELDHTTARIARLLYPRWGVRQDDFTRAPLPSDTYDVVIGNPPFADIPIKSDPKYPQGFLLHDYFFAKSLDAVRPGGLLAFISSAGTMNKGDAAARNYLADRADLVGAIRLPGNAFEKNAGTSVTTDILFLRKRLPDESPGSRGWTETVEVTLPDKEGNPRKGLTNRYFQEHPEMVIGEQGFFDPLYAGRYAVRVPKGFDLDAALRTALGRLPEQVMSPWQGPTEHAEVDFGTSEHKEGSYYLKGSTLMQRQEGVGRAVPSRGQGVTGGKSLAEVERIKAAVPIRDALREVYKADLAEDTANALAARGRLNEHYDAFVKRFGPINKAVFQYRRPTIIQQESARAEAREEARYAGTPWREGDFDSSSMVKDGSTLAQIARARQNARDAIGETFDEGSFKPEDMPDVVVEKRPNIDPFMDDPESYRLRAVEHYNDQTGEAKKTEVFTRNIITREREPEIKSVNDALLWTLNQKGRFDLPEVSRLAKLSESEVIEQLGNGIYRTPGTDNEWEVSDEYLSGNVRRKLRVARAAAQRNSDLQRNVDALVAVQPIPLPPSEISANLGMPWIPTDVVEKFATDGLGLNSAGVSYTPAIALWVVNGDTSSPASLSTWGTPDRHAIGLIQDALNHQDPRVYREWKDAEGTHRELDTVATQAAQEKLLAIKEKFRGWLWSDEARAKELADLYNENYNSLVVRKYDGGYLTTPGISDAWQWRPHQTSVIARIIQSGNTYMAHAVGAGKTSAMIGAGMEMRRLGLVRKPMYAVPNNMLGQFTKEFYEQYPTARIAVADDRRFHTDRRKQFIANVANEDLDAIIITHSAFGMIPISDDFQDGLIGEQIDQYRTLLEDPDLKGQENRITRSRLEKQIERLEQRLSGKATKKRDQVFTFEEMGVDFLFVDEAHLFRKLDFATKMSGVKGITPEGSKASWDLYVKTRYLQTVNPDRNLVMASGTPITNTMAELFSVSRYLQPHELADRELNHFDAWAGAFGDTVTELEQNAAGGYQPVTRFAKFVNVPELSNMVRQSMDVVTNQELSQYVTRPAIKGGKRQMNLAEKTDELAAYQSILAARMQAIKERRGPPKPGDDIILSVINDGRHAAIDMRLVDPVRYGNNPGSKLNRLVDNVYRIWQETKRQSFYKPEAKGYAAKPFDKGPATQMIFADLGLSGTRGFAVPDYIRSELMRRGVPKNEIALIGDYKNHAAKQRLFNDMNAGTVRVLIGSSSKMGVGVNAQRRLYANHNLDPLWYPANDEQRNGRILRQGNTNPEIEIHDYSTKGTYDSTMWGMMEKKARFIEGFFRGDPTLRDMEDLGEASQYEQAKAMTTADPRLIKLTEYRQELEKAIRRKAAFEREIYANAQRVANAKSDEAHYSKRIPQIERDIARRQDLSGDNFKASLNGKTYADRVEFGNALLGEVELLKGGSAKRTVVGSISSFPIEVSITKGKNWSYQRLLIAREGDYENDAEISASALGTVRSAEYVLSTFERGLEHARERVAQAQKTIEQFRPQLGKKFEGQAEIDRLEQQVRAIEQELAAPPPAVTAPAAPEVAPAVQPAPYGMGRRPQAESLSIGPGAQRALAPAEVQQRAARFDKMIGELRARLEQVGLSGKVALKLRGAIFDRTGTKVPGARGRYFNRVVEIALGNPEKLLTLDHEVVHALRDLGVFRPGEWSALERAARADKELIASIRERYKSRNPSEEQVTEEAIADMNARYQNDPASAKGFVKSAFERLRKFFEAVGNWLRGNGFQSARDVMDAIDRGELGARAPAMPAGPRESFALGEEPKKPKFRPTVAAAIQRGEHVTFDKAESEARWQDARKGMGTVQTWLARARERVDYIKAGFSRHFINLPNTPEFSPAMQELRKIEAAPSASEEKVLQTLRDLTKGLTARDLDLFTRKVVLDDLTFEVEQKHALPFGFTADDVRSELGKVDAALAKRPELQAKLAERTKTNNAIANEMVKVGLLHKEQIKNAGYYRHQVLDYARAQTVFGRGTGNELRTPHWARRHGSEKDINANFLEAEYEWMQKALTDIQIVKSIDWFDNSKYNVRGDVVANAKANNDRLVTEILRKDMELNGYTTPTGRQTSPVNEQWMGFKQRIAVGLKKVSEALEGGQLTGIPPEFRAVAADLAAGADSERSIFPFLSWILDNNKPGSLGAAQTFKAISQRKEWVRGMLGKRYADPMKLDDLVARGFAPEGYETWQPDQGDLLYTAKTLPEHVIDRMLGRIAEETAGAGTLSVDELRGAFESVRTVLAVGGPKYQLVIPSELAETFRNLKDKHTGGMVDTFVAAPMAKWKQWILGSPRRVLKYNLNNLSGDLDAVIAGNPHALKELPAAIGELRQVMYSGKAPSQQYRDAVERGVFNSALSAQEIPDINYLSEFKGLTSPSRVRKLLGPVAGYWQHTRKFTAFRENWLRYAAYLDFFKRLEAGESMRKIGYGASNREMIDALDDNRDKAAALARDLVGDYGAISHFGRELRRTIIQFWSWNEINFKRYWRLGINAWDQGIGHGFRTTGVIGASLGIRASAYLFLRTAAIYALVNLWNNLFFGSDEDQLKPEERAQLHLLIGHDPDGKVVSMRFQGALSDFLSWFGFEDAIGTMIETNKGRAGYLDILGAIAKAPVNKLLNGLTPLITAPVEFLGGEKYYPDVFNPRSIRDPWRNLAQTFSMEHEYDWMLNKPSRGYGSSLADIAVYRRDPGEQAYNQIRGLAHDWQQRQTGETGEGYSSPRSRALYDWRMSIRYGDAAAERDAEQRMSDLGIKRENRQESIKRAAPMGNIAIKDRRKFLDTLTPQERAKVDVATDWYHSVYGR